MSCQKHLTDICVDAKKYQRMMDLSKSQGAPGRKKKTTQTQSSLLNEAEMDVETLTADALIKVLEERGISFYKSDYY